MKIARFTDGNLIIELETELEINQMGAMMQPLGTMHGLSPDEVKFAHAVSAAMINALYPREEDDETDVSQQGGIA